MYLQKLVIQGFKSFANKTSLEFTPGVTAVVGPNGSGKSNIADAVRWVLGEQSLKTLRGKKSGDVIFAGSDKKTRLGYCQVDLHLDNEDRKAPIDFSEVIVSRRVYRDGEGEYFINKNKVRLQDILMLLAKSNFGQRSYSIISQGMIDMFLAASPSQRKEYFDEAAGVRQFQIKKEQAENKLNQTRENLHQAELLKQEIEPRLRSLTRQVRRLERREEVHKQLREIQHTYYSGLWHDLKIKHEAEEERYKGVETKHHKEETELSEIQQEMQKLALGSSRQDDFQHLQREYDRIVSEKNNLLREQAVLKGKIEVDREQKGDLDLVWLERRKEQLTADSTTAKHNLEESTAEIQKYSEQLKSHETQLQHAAKEHGDLLNKLNDAKASMGKKKMPALPEIAGQVTHIYNRQKTLVEKIEQAESVEDLRSIKAEVQTVTTELAQLNHKLGDAQDSDPHAIISLQESVAELLAAKDEHITACNETNTGLQVAKERQTVNEARSTELTDELEKVTKELERATTQKSREELAADIAADEKALGDKLKTIETELTETSNKIAGFNQEEQKKKEAVFELQRTFSKKQDDLNAIRSEQNGIRVELAKLETKQEDLEKEMVDELSDEARNTIYEVTEPPEANLGLFSEIQKLKKQLELIGGIDPQVSKEYEKTQERFDFLNDQGDDLTKAADDLEEGIHNLEETIKKQFTKAFEQINKHFQEYFKILFNGGNASLSLVREEIKDPEDDENDNDEEGEKDEVEEKPQRPSIRREKVVTGIDVHATPPGKRLKNIGMLSGGERALTSIALICAIIFNNPSPFVVLDEVDAALDESNSIRFASIIEKLSKKTQFILITHNRATMDKSNILYGVTMGDDGVSRLLSINMEEAEKVIKNE